MIQKHVKRQGVIAIIEYGREKITPWIALNGMHVVQGKVVMGIHMYMGLALKNNILVDVTEDYRKCTLPQTKLS
jgi:hypothetical protein